MTDPAETVDITSPIAWRRWLSIQLVRLRKAAGVKQADAARAIGASVGKLSYLENGERPISPGELEKLLPLYGVEPEALSGYRDAAAKAAGTNWLDAWSDQDLKRDGRRYVGLEDAASRIRAYDLTVLHGLLQTEDYARAVITAVEGSMAPEAVDSLVELRRVRQQRATSKSLSVVLDEATLHRQVGGREVLRRQLAHLLLTADEQPHVSLRVLPYSAGAHPAILGPFTILNFGWPSDPGVLFFENTMRNSEFLENRSQVYDFSMRFQELTDLALDRRRSLDVIHRAAQEI